VPCSSPNCRAGHRRRTPTCAASRRRWWRWGAPPATPLAAAPPRRCAADQDSAWHSSHLQLVISCLPGHHAHVTPIQSNTMAAVPAPPRILLHRTVEAQLPCAARRREWRWAAARGGALAAVVAELPVRPPAPAEHATLRVEGQRMAPPRRHRLDVVPVRQQRPRRQRPAAGSDVTSGRTNRPPSTFILARIAAQRVF